MYVALYDLTAEDERSLDQWESIDLGHFHKVRLRVHMLEGDVLAWVYVLDAYEGGLPSATYLHDVADAGRAGRRAGRLRGQRCAAARTAERPLGNSAQTVGRPLAASPAKRFPAGRSVADVAIGGGMPCSGYPTRGSP